MTDRTDGSPTDLERELDPRHARAAADPPPAPRAAVDSRGAAVALAPIVAACSSARRRRAPPSVGRRRPSRRRRAGRRARPPSPTRRRPRRRPCPTPEGELFVYNWDQYIGEDTVAKFEDEVPGIKVKYDKFPDAATQIGEDPQRRQGRRLRRHATRRRREIPALVRDGVIQPLDLEPDPERRQPRARTGRTRPTTRATPTRCRTTGGRPASPGTRPRSRTT